MGSGWIPPKQMKKPVFNESQGMGSIVSTEGKDVREIDCIMASEKAMCKVWEVLNAGEKPFQHGDGNVENTQWKASN